MCDGNFSDQSKLALAVVKPEAKSTSGQFALDAHISFVFNQLVAEPWLGHDGHLLNDLVYIIRELAAPISQIFADEILFDPLIDEPLLFLFDFDSFGRILGVRIGGPSFYTVLVLRDNLDFRHIIEFLVR